MAAKREQPAWLKHASLVAYGFSFLMFGLEVSLLGATAIDVAARAGAPEADLGIVFMINGLISIIGGAPSGWLVDHFPGHALLAASLGLQAVGLAFVPYQRSLAALAATFGCVACTWNIVNTCGNVLSLQQAPAGRRGAAFVVNLVNALFGAGALCAPLVADACLRAQGTTLPAYGVTAALTAAAAAVFAALPSPPTPAALAEEAAAAAAAAAGEAADAYGGGLDAPLLQAEGGGNDDGGGGGGGGDNNNSGKRRARAADPWRVGGPLTRVLLPAAAFVFLSVGLEVAVGGWATVYAVDYLGQRESDGHALTAAYWSSFTAGRALASAAAAAVAPGVLLATTLPLAGLGALIALALPASALAGGAAVAAFALVGLGVSTGFANCLALLSRAAPVNGAATGLLSAAAGAGTMLLPLAVGLAAKSRLGFNGLMWVTLAATGAQLVCLAPVMRAGGSGGGGDAAAAAEAEAGAAEGSGGGGEA